jgi:hypothetical protein
MAAAADSAMMENLAAEGRALIARFTVPRMADAFQQQYRGLVRSEE